MNSTFASRVWTTVGIVTLAGLLVYVFVQTAEILLLVFGGILFGVFLDGPASWLMRKAKMGRGWAVLSILIAFLSIAAGFTIIAGSTLAGQIQKLGIQIPEALSQMQKYLDSRPWGQAIISAVPFSGSSVSTGPFIGRITGFFSSFFTAMGSLVFIMILGVYLAMNPAGYLENMLKLLPANKRGRVKSTFYIIGRALRRWLLGTAFSMLIVGTLITVSTWIAGIPLPFALGFIAGILEFIPYIGPWLSAIPAILLAFTIAPVKVLYVAIIYFLVQNLEGYLITPVIQSRIVAMPPALLITAQIIMGFLAGIPGILLATPLTITAIIFIQQFYDGDFFGKRMEIIGK